MKKYILTLLLTTSTLAAQAQWKIGQAKKSIDYYNLSVEEGANYIYSENGDGTVTIYVPAFDLSAREWMVAYSPVAANMQFSGYYYGEVTDPKDDYVNIRKGPGTNYPVVEKLDVGDHVHFQKSNGSWLKVYEEHTQFLSGNYSFLGYIYKDRVKTPEAEAIEIEKRKLPVVLAEWKCPDDNHPHAIDLGIGTLWACCNVDADSPLQTGGYYAWGETEPKDYYGMSNHLAKDVKTDIASTSRDVAHVKWGDKWRMPSEAQIQELKDKCKYQWVVIDGVYGGMFTGPNGNSIFMPAAGRRNGEELEFYGTNGLYASSTYFVFNTNFDSNYFDPTCMGEQLGYPVRPVMK